MTDTPTFPGMYSIKSIVISPILPPILGANVEMDISGIVPKIVITESINNDSIRGFMEIMDNVGFLDQYSLRGEERLLVEIEDSLDNTKIYDFVLYRVDEVTANQNNDGFFYKAHFVSYSKFMADQASIVRSYQKPISEIVKDVVSYFSKKTPIKKMTDNYTIDQRDKPIVIEDTEDLVRLVIPHMAPSRAMKMLETRAYSQSSPSCSFRFFESANAFFFVSDEYLFENSDVKEFSYIESIPSTPDKFVAHMHNFTELTNTERFDTFEDMHSGGYHSKVIVLDILKREANLKPDVYRYNDNANSFFDVNSEQTVTDRHTNRFMDSTLTEDNARQFVVIKDYETNSGGQLRGEQHFPEMIHNRLAYRHHLKSVVLRTVGHGRLDLTCGDLINLNIKEFTSGSDMAVDNEQLGGRYLIEEISHVFDKDVSQNHYKLLKRNWGDVEDSKTRHFLDTRLGGI